MTRKSNVYIGQGRRDGIRVMKVGKANDVARRQSQLGIQIETFSTLISEAAAFEVERQLRQFAIKHGGIRHQGTIDWFRFDSQIYNMLIEFLDGEYHVPKTPPVREKTIHNPNLTEEEEIILFQQKYIELLREEVVTLERNLQKYASQMIQFQNFLEEVRTGAEQQIEDDRNKAEQRVKEAHTRAEQRVKEAHEYVNYERKCAEEEREIARQKHNKLFEEIVELNRQNARLEFKLKIEQEKNNTDKPG